MNRSAQVREVYAELRRSLGDRFTSNEMLKAAMSVVELFSIDEDDLVPRFELRLGGLPFNQWSLDVALADGGWRVLEHERFQGRVIEEQEEWEMAAHQGFREVNEGAMA